MAGSTAALQVKDLSVDYLVAKGVALHAVEGVGFRLEQGRSLGLVGESGCGKTTVMLALMRLLPREGRITSGSVRLGDRDLLQISENEMRHARWGEMALVFQGAMNAMNPVRTIESQIAEALQLHGAVSDGAAARQRTGELLEMVGIPRARGRQYPHQYSGGMRQRAIIAMALACGPRVLIADEPTTALDVMIQAQILDLLENLQKELNLALLMVTHDLGVVAETCNDVLVMYGGKLAEYAPSDTIYNRPLHPYTQRLMAAFPDVEHPTTSLASIPGTPPRLDDLPPGCRFAPRCDQAQPICSRQPPPEVQAEPGHVVACHLIRSGA
jgi:peptide/nickel transport system ATP-binding protein